MTQLAEKLKSELSQLTVQERAEIAHFLLHSLPEEDDSTAAAAWDAELARRWEEINNGTAVGEPADEVFTRLQEKYS